MGKVDGKLSNILKEARNAPSAVLLLIQGVLLLAYPYLRYNVTGAIFLAITTVVMLSVVVVVIKKTPALTWVAILFGVPSVATAVLEVFFPGNQVLLGLTSVFHLCFYFYASYALIKYIFADNVVTKDEWYATAAAFTVILWGYAYVFLLVEVIAPGSFTVFTHDENNFFEALFLSFTVLTSVGLSDVMPITDQARSVVMIGEVIGLFYMAIIVSRLVAMSHARKVSNTAWVSKTKKKDEEHDDEL